MTIAAVGTELVDCARIGRLIQRHGESFLLVTFTTREIAYCNRQAHAIQHFAARWAAKSAVCKACGWDELSPTQWSHIEIRGSLQLPMRVHFGRRLQAEIVRLGAIEISVSASYTRAMAVATAILVRKPASENH